MPARRSAPRRAGRRRGRRQTARGSGAGERRLPALRPRAFRAGHLTPVFFGSALSNFGVRELLNGIGAWPRRPRPQPAEPRSCRPRGRKVTGFVFKIQANMDPNHRDRVAFLRLCSGRFRRGMKLTHVRAAASRWRSANPLFFLARDRELVDEAFPGDIIGIPNHGSLRIGDTLVRGRSFALHRHSQFRARNPAPGAARRSDEGEAVAPRAGEIWPKRASASLFKPMNGATWIVGVVGHAAVRRARQSHRAANTGSRPASRRRPTKPRVGSPPTTRPSTSASSTPIPTPWPRIAMARWSFWRATPGPWAARSRTILKSVSPRSKSRHERGWHMSEEGGTVYCADGICRACSDQLARADDERR